MSGGQMGRVSDSRCHSEDPDFLILDVPSAGLTAFPGQYFPGINELYQAKMLAVFLDTHSMEEAALYAKRLLVMAKGKIVIDGDSAEVFQNHREALKK
jgi:energy-coupling factor transport system ATP-binding protein